MSRPPGRPPTGRAVPAAERMRQMRARRRAARAVAPPPTPPTTTPPPAPQDLLLERLQDDPQEAARWLRDRLGEDTAHQLGRALAPPAAWATLGGQRQLLNLDHICRAPDSVIPWVADRLAEDNPAALRDALEGALRTLAQVLRTIRG
jgi:hypothetical protein